MEEDMANKRNPAQQRQMKKSRAKKKRAGRIALVAVEALMIVILSVGCYAVSILSKLDYQHVSEENLYVYGNNDLTIALLPGAEGLEAPAETNEGQSAPDDGTQEAMTAEETTAEQKETGAWAVQADVTTEPLVIESDTDFLSHQNLVNGYWNILLLGFDEKANQSMSGGDYRADVIIVCSINATTKEVKLASIYRDTVVYQPTTGSYIKINDGVCKDKGGGIEEMINLVNLNFDLNIQDVVAVNWAALALAVNQLGGLELNITEEEVTKGIITGYLTEVVNTTGIATNGQFTHGGPQWCDGPKVVAYCRNRYSGGSDFSRTERQREVIHKLLEKATSVDLGTLISTITVVMGNMYTSLTLEDLMDLARDVSNYTMVGMQGYPVTNHASSRYLGRWAEDYGITWPVVPTSLVSNVDNLHQYLFGSAGVRSQNVQTISANINTISGF